MLRAIFTFITRRVYIIVLFSIVVVKNACNFLRWLRVPLCSCFLLPKSPFLWRGFVTTERVTLKKKTLARKFFSDEDTLKGKPCSVLWYSRPRKTLGFDSLTYSTKNLVVYYPGMKRTKIFKTANI